MEAGRVERLDKINSTTMHWKCIECFGDWKSRFQLKLTERCKLIACVYWLKVIRLENHHPDDLDDVHDALNTLGSFHRSHDQNWKQHTQCPKNACPNSIFPIFGNPDQMNLPVMNRIRTFTIRSHGKLYTKSFGLKSIVFTSKLRQ